MRRCGGVIAILVFMVVAGAQHAHAVVPTATSTTIIPLAGIFTVWPPSGPAGTTISVVNPAPCRSSADQTRYALVTFTALGEPSVPAVLLDIEAPANGSWEATFTVPADAPPTRTYAISARCVHSESTIFYYLNQNFDVTLEAAPTSTTSSSTTTSTTLVQSLPTTTTTATLAESSVTTTTRSPLATTTAAAVAASDATLPRTGTGTGTSGLFFVGGLFVATGAALAMSRHRR